LPLQCRASKRLKPSLLRRHLFGYSLCRGLFGCVTRLKRSFSLGLSLSSPLSVLLSSPLGLSQLRARRRLGF
jgi:hypothetical protein